MTGWGSTVAGASPLRLRPIRPEDAAFLLEVYGSTRAEELDLTDWDTAARAAFVQMQFTAQHTHYTTHYPDARYEIVTLGGADIGRLYVRRTDSDIVLMDIALLPAYRNRGLGSRILQTLLDEASAARRAVTLHVEANNPRARAWYERYGFVEVSSSGVHTLMRRDAGSRLRSDRALSQTPPRK
jgi:ribosomal protein S18 acetylase RimI-like enzyme